MQNLEQLYKEEPHLNRPGLMSLVTEEKDLVKDTPRQVRETRQVTDPVNEMTPAREVTTR